MENLCDSCQYGTDSSGENPKEKILIGAVIKDHSECVKTVIAEGVDLEYKDEHGKTSFIYAVEYGSVGCLALLTEAAGANVNVNTLNVVLKEACKNGQHQCVDLLLRAGAKGDTSPEPLTLAAGKGHLRCVQLLLEKLEHHPNTLDSALRNAFLWDREECIDVLAQAGADVNTYNLEGETPLFSAVKSGDVRRIQFLIESGADVNWRNRKKDLTPLMVAVAYSDIESIKTLIAAKAKINLRSVWDYKGSDAGKAKAKQYNALQYHLRSKGTVNKDIVLYLLAAGEKYDGYAEFQVPRSTKPQLRFKKPSQFLKDWRFCVWEMRKMFNPKEHLKQIRINLSDICRATIRKHLIELDEHTDLFQRIPMLGLPASLKKYLLHDDTDDRQSRIEQCTDRMREDAKKKMLEEEKEA